VIETANESKLDQPIKDSASVARSRARRAQLDQYLTGEAELPCPGWSQAVS
jgi:hypothetical protein